jgi:hypothetical protein
MFGWTIEPKWTLRQNHIRQVMGEENSSTLTRCDAYRHLPLSAPLKRRREG